MYNSSMFLYLVRHTETIWQEKQKYAGHSDIPLSKKGYKRAEIIAKWAQSKNFDLVLTSDLVRTKLLGELIASSPENIIKHSDLREINYGIYEGYTSKQMQVLRSKLQKENSFNKFGIKYLGGESEFQAAERVYNFLNRIILQKHDRDILFICHGTVTRLLLCILLEINLNLSRNIFPSLENGSVTKLEIKLKNDVYEIKGLAKLLIYNTHDFTKI